MADLSFSLTSMRGGLNDTDPAIAIADDQCVVAANVEFNRSMLGERRKGCTNVDLDAAMTGDANMQAITFLHRHLPTTDETAAELWVLGQHLTTQNFRLHRKTTAWSAITPAVDIDVTSGRGYQVQGQTLHGKLFLAYRAVGGVDRLMVWDGTTLRRTGLSEPSAPTVATAGGAGTFSGKRYYRVRMTYQVDGVTLRRSEPSEAEDFTPNGNDTGAVVTKPTTVEDATHWEVEASLDDANYYVIQTLAVGTTTYEDSTAFTAGYAANELSEELGDYSLPHSCKFLSSDEDRLILGSSWEDDELASRFAWTVVYNDPTGVGNDERIPIDTTNFLDLDGFAGGPLTGISQPIDGFTWAFKWSHIYRMERTNVRTKAYNPRTVTKSMGAIPGSIVEGVDQYGMPCLYFLDPKVGPCRTGGNRLVQMCGRDIQKGIWGTINLDATIIARSVYYPDSKQVHWWIATSGSAFPNKKIILQTNETRESPDGIRKGWATADGKISRAYAVCMFAEDIDDGNARSLVLKPFIGVVAADGYVLRCDTGDDDDGTEYAARIVSKPHMPMGLLKKFGVVAAALLATAATGVSVKCNLVRDFDTADVIEPDAASLTATATESQVIRVLNSYETAGLRALQVEIEDPAVIAGNWEINRFEASLREEEEIG